MKTIDGCRIIERLATSVFLVEWGRRHAAVKLLPEAASEPDVLARCFNAACAASALRHPGIARVYDVGVSAAGVGFVVSELVAGESLARRLARGPLPLKRALAIAGQLAHTLAIAHRHGVVHGALEPDHIILDGDRVCLINFGVAHLQSGFDECSDVYALGCMLFEMITGHPPFGTVYRELVAPSDVCKLVGRLLETNPRDRLVSAAIVAALVDGLSCSAAPAVALQRLRPAQALH